MEKEKLLSLWDTMKKYDNCCLDITGKEWDWGVAVCLDLEEPEDESDYYCMFMHYVCINIQVTKYVPDWYTQTTIEEFLWENRDVFEPFFNENNREGYRPKDYDQIDPNEDTGFYEAYMMPMESLISGNYSESAYKRLYKKLIEKDKKKQKSL